MDGNFDTNTEYSNLLICEYLLSMAEEESPDSTKNALENTHIKKNQMILTKGSKIVFTGPVTDPLPKAKEKIDLKNHLVCPGLINTHTHLPMTLFRGLGDHLTLKNWLEKIIFPLEKKFIGPDFIKVGTELALLELIKTGTTTICDMYFHTPLMAELFEDYGLRGVLAVDVLSSFSDWKKDLNTLSLRYSQNKTEKKIYPAIACHAPYTCSPQILKLTSQTAKEQNLPVTIHVAETKWEVKEIQKQYGKTPVSHLKDCGILDTHSIFAHCVHITKDDMRLMAENQIAISYNPESNMKLGSGIAPILQAMEKGITIGLGTDGPASNNNLNLFTEMDTGAKLQKLQNPEQVILPYRIFQMATTEGAKALGLKKVLGKIKPGFFADIIALNLNHPHLYPRYDLISHLVYSAVGMEVDFMMCHGQVLMKEKEVLNKDEDKIFALAEKIKQQIQKQI